MLYCKHVLKVNKLYQIQIVNNFFLHLKNSKGSLLNLKVLWKCYWKKWFIILDRKWRGKVRVQIYINVNHWTKQEKLKFELRRYSKHPDNNVLKKECLPIKTKSLNLKTLKKGNMIMTYKKSTILK